MIKPANAFSSGHPSDLDISLTNELLRFRQFIMCQKGIFFFFFLQCYIITFQLYFCFD